MRIIDADALMPNAEYKGKNDFVSAQDIANAPTIDAVQVVRCGECRHRITAHGISDGWVLCSKPYTERGNAMHRNDWFCADGDRKTDEP
ncbi:MAG: hypothetical protein J6S14_12350 [Clostridia bacterium]|nr:hypothetical protein [Clostridia bacterium]